MYHVMWQGTKYGAWSSLSSAQEYIDDFADATANIVYEHME